MGLSNKRLASKAEILSPADLGLRGSQSSDVRQIVSSLAGIPEGFLGRGNTFDLGRKFTGGNAF